MEYDSDFGTLARSKPRFPLDGYPLVTGLACLLKQFHPLITRQTLQYVGLYIRASLHIALGPGESEGKLAEIPSETSSLLVFVHQLTSSLQIPKEHIYEFIPSYIFETALSFVK